MFQRRRLLHLSLALALFAGCSEQPTVVPASTAPIDPVAPVVTLSGAFAKGPFILGSSLSVTILDASLRPTGEVFPTQTRNDLGEFEVELEHLGPVHLDGSGFYYNEVTGTLSQAPIVLRATYEVTGSGTQAANVNVITHLSNGRVEALVLDGVGVTEAVAQAEDELREALGIGPAGFDPAASGTEMSLLGGDTDANAYVFAVSTVLAQAAVVAAGAGGPVDARLQELLNSMAAALAADGTLPGATVQQLAEAELLVNTAKVEANLAQRLSELGSSAEVPDIDRILDTDGDGVLNVDDNCGAQPNPTQEDSDEDGIGDTCDTCPDWPDGQEVDADGNGPGHRCDLLGLGGGHSCQRLPTGRVRCWGNNAGGQLGDGMTAHVTPCPNESDCSATPVEVVGVEDAVEVRAGESHTCARRRSGTVACWGTDSHGQLGNGTFTGGPATGATDVVELTDAVELSVNAFTSCARRASGQVACWGTNAAGNLGDGTTVERSTPVEVTGLDDAVEIAVGGSHACARRQSAQVVCWGFNAYGQLGDGVADHGTSVGPEGLDVSLVPVPVANLSDAVELAAGGAHTCARRATGSVVCWGNDKAGALGDGDGAHELPKCHDNDDCSRVPVPVSDLTDVVELAAGGAHTCARLADRSVRCWGSGYAGQLGYAGPVTVAKSPLPMATSLDALEIAAGKAHSCLRHAAGIACTGENQSGQLGDGTTESRNALVELLDP